MSELLTPVALPAALLGSLRELIRQGCQQALRAMDMVQEEACLEIGRHIVECGQGGETRAPYGKKLIPQVAAVLNREFGKGFDATNLRHMRGFYQAFPIRDALRRELSWTHYRLLLPVSSSQACQWYMNEAAEQNWSSRALDRQIDPLYFERLLLSGDSLGVSAEANANLAALPQTLREFVLDPVMLEFLGLPGTCQAHAPGHWVNVHECPHVRRPEAWARGQPDGWHFAVPSKNTSRWHAIRCTRTANNSLPPNTGWRRTSKTMKNRKGIT